MWVRLVGIGWVRDVLGWSLLIGIIGIGWVAWDKDVFG